MKTLITGLFLLLAFAAHSQTQGIKGVVTEKGSNDTLMFAGVQLQFTPYMSVTDEDGNYSFVNIPAGKYILTIHEDGYETVSDTIAIAKGDFIVKKYELIPIPDNPLIVSGIRSMGNNRKNLR